VEEAPISMRPISFVVTSDSFSRNLAFIAKYSIFPLIDPSSIAMEKYVFSRIFKYFFWRYSPIHSETIALTWFRFMVND